MRYSVSYMYSQTDKTHKYVNAHSFSIEEGGVLVFYNASKVRVEAFRKWFVVEESP